MTNILFDSSNMAAMKSIELKFSPVRQITIIDPHSVNHDQDAEGFNAVHHVHSMVLELQTKHEKLTSTTAELVNEYNRREKTFEELVENVERLQQNKADKQDVNQEINVKADKMELESKVSMNQFDEGFNLLDRGLSEALEKMESQVGYYSWGAHILLL